MLVFFVRRQPSSELCKATILKEIDIPGYTRADGTYVPSHRQKVHFNPDIDQAAVLAGKGSHSQRQALKRLQKMTGWDALSSDHQHAHVLKYATELQQKASMAAKRSTQKKAEAKSGVMITSTAGQRKLLAAEMPGLREMSTAWRSISLASASDATNLILASATAYKDVSAKLGLANYSTELSNRIDKYAQTQDSSLLGEMNNLLSGLDNLLVSEHLLDAYKKHDQ